MNKKLVKVVAAIIENKDGKFLIVQEGKKDSFGIWKPVSERLKNNEEPKNGLIRGVSEETGYKIEIVKQINHYNFRGHKGDELECFDFYAKVIGGEPKKRSGEIINMKWVDKKSLQKLMLNCPPNHHYGTQISDFLRYEKIILKNV
jgi:ADP-ribose pyrophosphatase YjhB (NUDIX family)